MLTYLKYLIQLILSPQRGWDDIAETNPDPEELLRTGLYPLMGLTAATEFLGLAYHHGKSLAEVLVGAVGDFGAYFISIFIAKLIFELYLESFCHVEHDRRRSFSLIIFGIGLMVLFQLLRNCLPWNLLILKFLPVYVILVLSKANKFMGAGKNDEMRLLGLSSAAIVGAPMLIYYIIFAII
ncbi:MAG: hypothetical protein K2I69_02200 [Muribaculaceae bacterium]|nr:hypothetical protein [Muribaculaceae bacterium]